MKIELFNRYSGEIEEELVYGEKVIEWLYTSWLGRYINRMMISTLVSKLYGVWQDTPWSRFKIEHFCKQYNILLSNFLPEEGRTLRAPYSTFNKFFIRKFKPKLRVFNMDPNVLPAFIEGRYLGYNRTQKKIPVKGVMVDPQELLGDTRWATLFQNGPILIGRLAPVDYHRFHFPLAGTVKKQWRVPGNLYSVNPIALQRYPDIFLKNERQVAIIETADFGYLAYIEVGATCVGKIVQTYCHSQVERGEEKGYFLFGGSTVIIMGEAGRWIPVEDIAKHSVKGCETYVKLGDNVGVRCAN